MRAGRLDEALEWLRRAVDEFGFIHHTFAAKDPISRSSACTNGAISKLFWVECVKRVLGARLRWLHECSRLLLLLRHV
jgi:hypothetical protein